jgi:hypothetical protein
LAAADEYRLRNRISSLYLSYTIKDPTILKRLLRGISLGDLHVAHSLLGYDHAQEYDFSAATTLGFELVQCVLGDFTELPINFDIRIVNVLGC